MCATAVQEGHLIGPEAEHWDFAMLVRKSSLASLLAFLNHISYLEGFGHRTVAIEDFRLMPITESPKY